MVRLRGRTIPLGIAALTLGFFINSPSTRAGLAETGLPGPGISVFGTIHPDIFRFRPPLGSVPPADGVRMASLDSQTTGLDCQDKCRSATADERIPILHDRPASFEERFASANTVSSDERFGSVMRVHTASLQSPPGQEVPKKRADAAPTLIVSTEHVYPDRHRKGVRSPLDDGRTAIYDITAHTVYLPGGHRLEAHSGLGDFMDNPRHVHVRMRGSTPPNVYNLAFRERLFHGVRAIRLKPVDDNRMYGRGGILAHTYMLGPNGQSNGCVSFRNYPEFLGAFQKGQITRLAVVERLESPPGRLAAGQLPDSVRDLLNATDRNRHYAAAVNN